MSGFFPDDTDFVTHELVAPKIPSNICPSTLTYELQSKTLSLWPPQSYAFGQAIGAYQTIEAPRSPALAAGRGMRSLLRFKKVLEKYGPHL